MISNQTLNDISVAAETTLKAIGAEIPQEMDRLVRYFLLRGAGMRIAQPEHDLALQAISLAVQGLGVERNETMGSYRVGTEFNPSASGSVSILKAAAADLIDMTLASGAEGVPEGGRQAAMAASKFEDGAMNAVKAATKRPMQDIMPIEPPSQEEVPEEVEEDLDELEGDE
ncbi:hypothetical protein [Thalassobius sp. Cn5-15]|uniref:hypothetical protein n=1 Tax=Thalassobius sp. Cn5-15 TaxID=2917763 RepID=UPI001EF30ACB|nr:hypothetical protein [Thalassobius sp. Cn5-15]MCG7492402.1 hypothetical protein [Thalassobius sp. Cn5-15]